MTNEIASNATIINDDEILHLISFCSVVISGWCAGIQTVTSASMKKRISPRAWRAPKFRARAGPLGPGMLESARAHFFGELTRTVRITIGHDDDLIRRWLERWQTQQTLAKLFAAVVHRNND
jgi:hypothetical protein